MNMNIDEIRGPLAGFLAAAMIFASAGTAATQDNTVQASAARTVIQTEINAAGVSAGNERKNKRIQPEFLWRLSRSEWWLSKSGKSIWKPTGKSLWRMEPI